jgi:3-hydroxyisobutyrate dehydrogenase-like beta-hydroxyacid dehydrogenase
MTGLERIAVLGLGLMGTAFAERFAGRGHEVRVWNRTPGRATGLAGQDCITVADEAGGAIAQAETVILSLSDYDAISEVLFSESARAALAGRRFLQMGTIAPAQSRRLAGDIAAAGGEYLEAPVLGSIPEARQGTLILMVGGELRLFERSLELLKVLGPKPMYIGPVGQAATVKLALNQLIAGLTSSFALSLGLITQAGLDVEQFMGILRDSALYAPTFDKKLQRMLGQDYGNPNFPVRHLLKDVNLFMDAAGEAGLDVGVLLAIRELLMDTEQQGLQGEDYSALYESIDRHPVFTTSR